MTRRDDFLDAFWIEPHFGLAGYPDTPGAHKRPRKGRATGKPERPPRGQESTSVAKPNFIRQRGDQDVPVGKFPSDAEMRRRAKEDGVRLKESKNRTEAFYERELGDDPAGHPKIACIVLRTRVGFRYERVVRMQDYVTQREAAKLLGLPVMTVFRWVDLKQLKSKTLNGYSVIRLHDVLAMSKRRGKPIKMSWRIEVVDY